jgi:hypothetical protein
MPILVVGFRIRFFFRPPTPSKAGILSLVLVELGWFVSVEVGLGG